MEINKSNNQSSNSTVIIYGDNASPIFAGFSITLSVWIIVFNSFVVLRLLKNKQRLIQNTFTLQILTLSVSDFFVGLTTLPVYVTGFTSDVSYEHCLYRFVILLSAQAVEQFHIFGICINRVSVIYQLTTPRKISGNRGVVAIYLLVNWVVFLAIYSVPFGIWGKYRHTLTICSLNELFQDNYKTYITYSVSFYILFFVLINCIYVTLIIKINFTSRENLEMWSVLTPNKKEVSFHTPNKRNSGTKKCTLSADQVQSQDHSLSDVTTTGVTESKQKSADVMSTDESRKKIIRLLHVAQEGTSEDKTKTHELENVPLNVLVSHQAECAVDMDSQPTTSNDQINSNMCQREHEHQSASSTIPVFMSQRRALSTIGKILDSRWSYTCGHFI